MIFYGFHKLLMGKAQVEIHIKIVTFEKKIEMLVVHEDRLSKYESLISADERGGMTITLTIPQGFKV
jgi:hypothetical protein